MKWGLVVTFLFSLVAGPSRGEEKPDFPELSEEQLAAASLSSLLQSGKARFVSETPSEEKRLRSVLAERTKTHELEAELFSMRNSLTEQFERRHGDRIRERTVVLTSDDGVPLGRGVLVHPAKGWVIAPLDLVEGHEKGMMLVFHDGSKRRAKHEVLSRAENLALFDFGDQSLTEFARGKALRCSSSARVGSIIAASGNSGRLVVGGISAIESSFQRRHRRSVRDQIDTHLKAFSVSVDEVTPRFASVLLSDLALEKEFRGAPVFTLQGEFVGVAMSRVDLPETVVIPAITLREKLIESGRELAVE